MYELDKITEDYLRQFEELRTNKLNELGVILSEKIQQTTSHLQAIKQQKIKIFKSQLHSFYKEWIQPILARQNIL